LVAHVCARVLYGWVAHGWNINELSTGKHAHLIDPLWGCVVCVGYWLWLHGVCVLLVRTGDDDPLGGCCCGCWNVVCEWCVVCMVWHAVGF